MKIQILALLSIGLLVSCNKVGNSIVNIGPAKEGKGAVVEKAFPGDFDEITVQQSIKAEIIKSDTEKVVISAPSDLMEYVEVTNTGGNLSIGFKDGTNINANKISAKIYAKDFTEIEANSAAEITLKDKFMQEKTKILASSAGSIKGEVEANKLDIDVSSSGEFSGKIWAVDLKASSSSAGNITINGKAKSVDMEVSSGSSLDAKNVVAELVEVDASSGGSLSISVSESLKATASSGGSIDVTKKGELKLIKVEENSGGSISVK